MKFLDAVAIFVESAEPLIRDALAHEARETIRKTLAAYDALEPKPEDWAISPVCADYYVISANGQAWWSDAEPIAVESRWTFSAPYFFAKLVEMPEGIAWTDCKWARPKKAPGSWPHTPTATATSA